MSPSFVSHVTREAVINGITNAVFNGGIAWWLVKHREAVPVWGGNGLAVDFAATGLILVFIVTLIVMPLARRKVMRGEFPSYPWGEGSVGRVLIFMSHRNLLICGLVLGVTAALLFVPPVLLVAQVMGISVLSVQHFALVKGIWAGVVAAMMVATMLAIVAIENRAVAAGAEQPIKESA